MPSGWGFAYLHPVGYPECRGRQNESRFLPMPVRISSLMPVTICASCRWLPEGVEIRRNGPRVGHAPLAPPDCDIVNRTSPSLLFTMSQSASRSLRFRCRCSLCWPPMCWLLACWHPVRWRRTSRHSGRGPAQPCRPPAPRLIPPNPACAEPTSPDPPPSHSRRKGPPQRCGPRCILPECAVPFDQYRAPAVPW